MAQLSGGGSWLTLQKQKPGTKTEGRFQGCAQDIPCAYGEQDVLKLEIDGEVKMVGCPTALGRVFRANPLKEGTPVAITYEGMKNNPKTGKTFHSFSVETVEEDASFPHGANAAPAAEDAELEKRLAAARARRAA